MTMTVVTAHAARLEGEFRATADVWRTARSEGNRATHLASSDRLRDLYREIAETRAALQLRAVSAA
jgi:hypothetical protein